MPAESVFISSTSTDLLAHRAAVNEALRKSGYHPVDMMDFGARSEGATAASLEEVADSDIFGFVPPGSDVSITEQEFIHARELGKQWFCFMVDPAIDWPQEFREEGPGATKLQTLKARIESELVRATFTTPDNLALQVVTSLTRREKGEQKLLLEAASSMIPGAGTFDEAIAMIGAVLDAEEIVYEFDNGEFIVPFETTQLIVSITHNDRLGLLVEFKAELANEVDIAAISGEVGASLLLLAWTLPIGGVALDEPTGTVWYVYSIPAALLTEEVIFSCVSHVAVTADSLDEEVREMMPSLTRTRTSRRSGQ